jgi:hypothetical protein
MVAEVFGFKNLTVDFCDNFFGIQPGPDKEGLQKVFQALPMGAGGYFSVYANFDVWCSHVKNLACRGRRGFFAKISLPYGSTAASGSRGLAFATLSPFHFTDSPSFFYIITNYIYLFKEYFHFFVIYTDHAVIFNFSGKVYDYAVGISLPAYAYVLDEHI